MQNTPTAEVVAARGGQLGGHQGHSGCQGRHGPAEALTLRATRDPSESFEAYIGTQLGHLFLEIGWHVIVIEVLKKLSIVIFYYSPKYKELGN